MLNVKTLRVYIFGVLWCVASPIIPLPTVAQSPPQPKKVPTLNSEPLLSNPVPTARETDYTLGAGDRIRVSVFQVPDFSGEYLVLVDGTITMPLVGTVSVEGLSLPQVSALLSERYTPYLKRPIVTVDVIQPRPLQIAVAGEVGSPGSYTIVLEQGQKIPLVTDLIRQAGGITTSADIGQVKVRRIVNGQEQLFVLDLWKLVQQGDISQDLTLRDGDTIFIPTQENMDVAQSFQLAEINFGIQADQEISVAIVGEVYRPGPYKVVPEQVTQVIGSGTTTRTRRQPPRLSTALVLAGGIKPLADVRQVEIRRHNRVGGQRVINVNLWELLKTGDINQDPILQEGDTILIPTAEALSPEESESLAAASFAPARIRVNVVGEVLKPGMIEIPPNTPLNQAIMAAGGFNFQRANQSQVALIRLNPNGTVTKQDINIDLASNISAQNNPTLHNNDVIVVSRSWLTSATDTLDTVFRPFQSLTGFANLIWLFGGRR